MRRARSRQAPPPSWGGAAARPVRRRCPRSGGQRLPGKPRRHGGKNSPLFAHFAEHANYVWRVLDFLFEHRLGPRLRLVCESTRRSEEHTSELQSLMRISYAVFCLKKKNIHVTKL